jgi:hypothetical protein
MTLVDVNDDFPSWTKKWHQALERFADIGTMLQDSHANNLVERFPAQRNLLDACLKNVHAARVAIVLKICFDRIAQIEGKHISAGFEHNLCEAAHAATRFKNSLTLHPRRPLRGGEEALAAHVVSHVPVEL